MKNSSLFASQYWHLPQADCQNLDISLPNCGIILNLNVKTRLGIKIAQLSGEPLIQYNELGHSADFDHKEIQKSLLDQLKQNNIDFLYFHNVRNGSSLHNIVENIGQFISTKKAPYIDLNGVNNLDDFYKTLSPKTRKSNRRSLKKLNQDFEVNFNVLIDDQLDEAIIDSVVSLKKRQLDQSGLTSRLFQSPSAMQHLKNVILKPNKDFQCVFSLLYCDGNLAAAEIGYLHEQVYYSFLGAMDKQFHTHSSGKCQLLLTIDWALQNGVQVFDLLAPEDEYKFSWTGKNYVEVYDILLPLNIKGNICGQIYYRTLRPILKTSFLFAKSLIK